MKRVERVEGSDFFRSSGGGVTHLETVEDYDLGRQRHRLYRIEGGEIMLSFDAICVNDLIERVIYESN